MGIGLGEFVIVLLVAFINISGSFEEDLEQEDFIKAKKSFETDFKQANSELARIQQQVLDTARREDAAMNVKN